MKELILATTNQGKLKEIKAMLKDIDINVLSMKDVLDQEIDIEETGTSFKENALIKASTIAKIVNKPVLADDSGLEVADDFLKGAGKGAKNSTSKLVKDVLKGKAGNNEATDILIDGGAAVVEDGIDSIIKGEKLTAGEALETFENGINDSAKGKMKESIFGESIDKKGEIIVDLSFNEENTKIIDGISERINRINNKDSNS